MEPAPTAAPSQVQPQKPDPIPEKVTQLQCSSLDDEFRSIFNSSLATAFKYFPTLAARFRAELQLLVNALYYSLTIGVDQTEPGNLLQNITYCSSTKGQLTKLHKVGLLLLDIVLPYIRKKLEPSESRWVVRLLELISIIAKILQYVNLVLFIKDGQFRNLTQRILRIEMKFINPKVSRLLDYSLMNRQLLWSIYEGFLSAVLPFLKKTLASSIKNIFYLHSYMGVASDTLSCMVCGQQELVLPQSNDACEHLACFYCIQHLAAGRQKFYCSTCGKEFLSWRPYQP